MGKSSAQNPQTPDPNALINAQSNANRINQFTPYGNLLYGSVGDQGQFSQGLVPEGGQSAAFTQETPFQTQLRAANEGTGLGLGNTAYNRVTGRTVVGTNPDGSPIFEDNPDFQNPFMTAPTLSGVSAAQNIDPTQLGNLQNYNQNISSNVALPTGLSSDGLTALQSDPEAFRSTIEQTLYDRQLGLLQPEFTRQRQELETNLVNRGIPITSDPYNQAINRFESQQGE